MTSVFPAYPWLASKSGESTNSGRALAGLYRAQTQMFQMSCSLLMSHAGRLLPYPSVSKLGWRSRSSRMTAISSGTENSLQGQGSLERSRW